MDDIEAHKNNSLNFSSSKSVNFLRYLTEIKKIHQVQELLTSDKVRGLESIISTETEETLFSTLEDILGVQKTGELKQISAPFELEFSDIWLKAEKIFTSLRDYYQQNISLLENIITNICSLTHVGELSINHTKIHLIISPNESLSAWFSWSPAQSSLVLECPLNELAFDKFAIGILAHEFFHLILRNNSEMMGNLKNISEQNRQTINLVNYGTANLSLVLEELLISSFIPEGYLAEKYLGLPVAESKNEKVNPSGDIFDFSQTRKICASRLYRLAKKYADGNLSLDKTYFQEIVEEIKKG